MEPTPLTAQSGHANSTPEEPAASQQSTSQSSLTGKADIQHGDAEALEDNAVPEGHTFPESGAVESTLPDVADLDRLEAELNELDQQLADLDNKGSDEVDAAGVEPETLDG